MKIIIGLGNPGKNYEYTRHNAGFLALDELISRLGLAWEKSKKFNALIIKTADEIYAKPLTFMNESGRAVSAILSYYQPWPKPAGLRVKNLPEILTVIHDDLDISLGKSKISVGSRSAGHKGVESIINALGTKNFRRIRIGIKTLAKDFIPAEKFVLEKFTGKELDTIKKTIKKITP